MYKTRKRAVLISINVLTIVCYIAACLMLLPQRSSEKYSWITLIVASIVFFAATFWGNRLRSYLMAKVRRDTLETGETVILNDFINRLRFCYSLDDFYVVIGDILEKQGDCAVLLVDRTKNYILYNKACLPPAQITTGDQWPQWSGSPPSACPQHLPSHLPSLPYIHPLFHPSIHLPTCPSI